MTIEMIFKTAGFIAIYFIFGSFIDMMFDFYFNYKNPLWRPITVILWPIAIIHLLICLIVDLIILVKEKENKS